MIGMTSIFRANAKALAVAAVVCVPFLAHEIGPKKTAFDRIAASRLAKSSQSTNNAAVEPELAAAIGAQAWKILPNIKNGRFESTAIQYRDDLYVFNGFGLGIKVETTIEKFDAGTQQWSVIGNSSVAQGTGVTHNGFVVVGNEVWMIGGRVGNHPGGVTSKVWKFNLITHKWSQGPQLPKPVAAGGAALVDNRIHWFGGLDANASCDVDNHYVYDLDNPSAGWTDISGIAPMPIPRNHFATVVHDDLIYAIGGQFTHDGCGPGTPDSALVHVFNPDTNIWTQVASLPAVQSHIEPSTFVHKGAIYVVGGATNGNKVYRYDPSQDDWDTVAELPQPLLAPVAHVVDDELVVSSGGAPATVPSLATYSIDMAQLLLPGANDNSNDDDSNQSDNTGVGSDASSDLTDPGLVSLEAEYYDTVASTGTHQWVSMNDAGASGDAAMTTTPDSNKIAHGAQGSPAIGYFAYFDRPGTWYLWVRGWGDAVNGEGSSDSLHAGLNGSLSATADKIDGFPAAGWNWSSSTRDGVRAKLEVPSAGIHAVNLWMREDGLAVDKILLTTDANYQPTGEGDVPSDNVSEPDSGDTSDSGADNGGPDNGSNGNDGTDDDSDSTPSEPVDTVDDTLTDLVDDADDTTIGTTDDSTDVLTGDNNQDTTGTDGEQDDSTATDGSVSLDGIVSIEVEDFDSTVSASGKQWVLASQSSASGNASMVTTPNTGLLKGGNQGSPVMNYQVYFDEPGTYTVWLRGWGDTVGSEGKNDSVHVGLNGTLGSAAAIQNFPAGWHWSSDKRSGGKATLNIPSSGVHTINIWMREDGLILDKLILASNAAYTPSGFGAAVTTGTGGTADTGNSSTDNKDDSVFDADSDTDIGIVDLPDISTDSSLISVEVENYASKSGDGVHQWTQDNKSGASGSAMGATPNTGKLSTKANGAAVMNYPLQFSEPGTYKVWLRGFGDSNGASKNDSVHVAINNNFNASQILENFPNSWSWSNKKRGGGSVTVNIPSAGTHVLNLSMREDGLILDKIILTKDVSMVPVGLGVDTTVKLTPDDVSGSNPDTGSEVGANSGTSTANFVAIRIEAEDYTSKNDRWVLTSPGNIPDFEDDPDGPHNGSASGKANLELLPDTRVTHNDPVSGGPDGSLWGNPGPGPSIDYVVNFPEAGRYLVYVKTYSTNSEDNGIHVGINGTKPESGRRMQTCAKNKWVWTSAQRTNEEHCGVRKQIWLDVPTAGPNEITFYAREDGFELDQILLLKEKHGGVLDCFPKFNDEIRCENAVNGAKVSDTDIPLSTTVGNDDSSGEGTTGILDTASTINFGAQWLNQYTSDGSVVQARHEAGGVVVNGKLYVLGGRGTRSVSVYDPIANNWSQKSTAPIELNHFQPVAYKNKIWVIGAFTGGYPNENSVADIYVYTPSNDTWEKAGTIPQNRRRGSAGAVLHNGLIYIVGGNTNGHNPGAKPWFDSFNPATGEWRSLPDAPTARDHLTASVSNNKLVVAAGRQSAFPNVFANTVSSTNVYNFDTQSWSNAKNIPTARAGAMSVAVGNEVVLIGGEVADSGDAKDTVESYNVVSNTWRQLGSLQVGRHSGAAAVLNSKIHVVSGSERKGGSPESVAHEVLDI